MEISIKDYRDNKEGMTVSVPVHGKDVPTGLLHQILKDAGLK